MKIGDKAPDFAVPDQSGAVRRLAEFRGRPLVLFFYPRASTSGCTIEAQGFRDAAAKFARAGIALAGASPDTVAAQKKFADNEHLPFSLLADADQKLCEAYNVMGEKSLYGRKYYGVIRTTVLIVGDGRIARIWSPVKPAGHAEAVLEAVRGGEN
ncbi:MAG TPA: peroxiredoxin [Terriglobales bacterium]|nr:peroxiredoxin [Terriglobales bacterium]